MYEKQFNLKRKPFELVPNPEFLYLSRSHRRAMTYLEYGIREHIGFVLLTGEVGAGKTTLLRNMIRGLGEKHVLASIFNTMVSSEQLIAMINEEFGLPIEGRDKVHLLRQLNDFLVAQYADNNHAIIVIDEGQNLNREALEEIRMLSNLETEHGKLVQIILVGQPELRQCLTHPEMRQLRQRISVSCHLHPLTLKETEEYIFHRLAKAGDHGTVSFERGVMDLIHGFSRGIPRLINIAGDFLLLSAHVEGTRNISLQLTKEVIEDLEMDHLYWGDGVQESESTVEQHQIVRDLARRLKRIEQALDDGRLSGNDGEELLKRLDKAENRLKNMGMRSADSLRNTDTRFAELSRAIQDLREADTTLYKRILQLRDQKKGLFWKSS